MALMGPGPATRAASSAPGSPGLACRLMRDGQWADAYRMLCALPDRDRTPAVRYNLGLCHLAADEPDLALEQLDAARALLGPTPARPQPADETQRRLLAKQAGGEGYLLPVEPELPRHCPEAMGENLQRLLVDVCVQLELWERVAALAAPLAGRGYANIERALERARGGG